MHKAGSIRGGPIMLLQEIVVVNPQQSIPATQSASSIDDDTQATLRLKNRHHKLNLPQAHNTIHLGATYCSEVGALVVADQG